MFESVPKNERKRLLMFWGGQPGKNSPDSRHYSGPTVANLSFMLKHDEKVYEQKIKNALEPFQIDKEAFTTITELLELTGALNPTINTPPVPPPADTALQEADSSALVALIDEVFSQQKKRRRHYSMKQKRDALVSTEGMSQRKAASAQGVSRWTLTTWRRRQGDIFAFRGSEKALSRAPGRPEILPFKVELNTFMKDTRRGSRSLTASIMTSYVRDEHASWLDGYVKDKKGHFYSLRDAASAPTAVCIPPRIRSADASWVEGSILYKTLYEKLEDLETVQQDFAKFFKRTYGAYKPSEIFNCDETGIYFDMPPGKILFEKGKSAAITAQQKHSARLTTVCTIRGDGVKLHLLFIVR
ncbi:hypothetical protein PHMEG_00011698, partial [Phytophthora megakarya]